MRLRNKRRNVIVGIAAVVLALLIASALGARLCFSARIYATSLGADDHSLDYAAEDGNRIVFQNKDTIKFLSGMVLLGKSEDATGEDLQTWPTPLYFIGDWEIGGYEKLTYWHMGRFYIFSPKDHAAREEFNRYIRDAELNLHGTAERILKQAAKQ